MVQYDAPAARPRSQPWRPSATVWWPSHRRGSTRPIVVRLGELSCSSVDNDADGHSSSPASQR